MGELWKLVGIVQGLVRPGGKPPLPQGDVTGDRLLFGQAQHPFRPECGQHPEPPRLSKGTSRKELPGPGGSPRSSKPARPAGTASPKADGVQTRTGSPEKGLPQGVARVGPGPNLDRLPVLLHQEPAGLMGQVLPVEQLFEKSHSTR